MFRWQIDPRIVAQKLALVGTLYLYGWLKFIVNGECNDAVFSKLCCYLATIKEKLSWNFLTNGGGHI